MEYGFKKTAQLLAEEKIFAPRFLPYATQLIPLSCICATLSNQIDNASIKEKVLRWYWCGVFGELYGGANETRFSQDLPDVVDWVNGGAPPSKTPASRLAVCSRYRRVFPQPTRGFHFTDAERRQRFYFRYTHSH